MGKKINISELLKDCPKGMELDCALYENVEFDYIEQSPELAYPIHCVMKINGGYDALVFTHNGCNDRHPNAKCVIFPKGKTTWEGFVPPCRFNDGDIITDSLGTYIFKGEGRIKGTVDYYFGIHDDYFCVKDNKHNPDGHCGCIVDYRLATEEEKQKLFNAIKENGYKWNAETKTLEKLPKFKDGDIVAFDNTYRERLEIFIFKDKKENNTLSACYLMLDGDELYLEEDMYYVTRLATEEEKAKLFDAIKANGYKWNEETKTLEKLTEQKFDITTLKPFDKVLVRDNDEQMWTTDIFSFYNKKHVYPFMCVGHYTNQCIPYEQNKHLLGTTSDCDDFYKTWE